MSVTLNSQALGHARRLIQRGECVADKRDDWSAHAPTAAEGNTFIKAHGIKEYSKWFLGEDTDQDPSNKGRYLFPYGDFKNVHRCAVISGESRAGQHDHTAIKNAEKDLLERIDKKNS